MSRAVFLPSPGDPYVLLHCLSYIDNWINEIDKLYININSAIDPKLIEKTIVKLNHPKMDITYVDHSLDHGGSLNYMLERCSEDNILLIEDDSIIFKKGIVDRYFRVLENNEADVIGSPRGSCTNWIWETARERYNLDYSGFGDKGPNLWPCFLYTKRQTLLDTDRNFCARRWSKGDSLMGQTVPGDEAGDTFVNTSIQFREKGLRIMEIPQYHCGPDDFAYVMGRLNMFDGQCGYLHFGSLSSGIHGYLHDIDSIPLASMKLTNPRPVSIPLPSTEQERTELERRVSIWEEASKFDIDAQWDKIYREAVQRVIKENKLDWNTCSRWSNLYRGIIYA